MNSSGARGWSWPSRTHRSGQWWPRSRYPSGVPFWLDPAPVTITTSGTSGCWSWMAAQACSRAAMIRLPCCCDGPGFGHDRVLVFSVCTLSGRSRLEGGGLAPGRAGPACPCFLAQGSQRLRAQGWGLKMLSAERLERILGCPCGWRGGPVTCEAPTRHGGQPGGLLLGAASRYARRGDPGAARAHWRSVQLASSRRVRCRAPGR